MTNVIDVGDVGMGHVPRCQPGRMDEMTLPEEFVLLLQGESGWYQLAQDNTDLAELGELLLRGRVELVGKKIQVLDASPSGIGWLDEFMAQLRKKAGPTNRPVHASLLYPRQQRKVHRAALAERGLMRQEQETALFIPYTKYFPDTGTRQALLDEIREAARGEREPDKRLVLLAALVSTVGLTWALGLDRAERKGLKEISKDEPFSKLAADLVAMRLPRGT